jgi:CheY-like chemotaxis protein
LRITVTDTGAGIAPDKLNLIFKPFERLGAEHGPIEGTGIGLALCKQLVELMDGRMGVTSSIGRGSTFWIELPWAPPAAALGASPAPAPARSKSGHTMLYVEDNAANLRLVDAIVRKLSDAHLLSAIDGESGVELAKRHLPDVILLDIHLPKMDGYAVLEALRADSATRRIPVIALSADAMPADVERARRAGFSDYITKPIEVPELIRVLERVLTPDPSHTPSTWP